MPKPAKDESHDDYISRCIPIVIKDGTAKDDKQANAVCNSMWDEAQTASEMLRDYIVGEFRGDFPQIDADTRVDIGALTAGDESPFYLTLPVGRAGEVSDNGLHYDEELIGAIQQQLVGRGGSMGHIKDEERATAFPIEDADWVGVQRQGDTLWGKAYIPPGEAREYIRRLKARGGQLATSIYGPYQKREPLKDGTYRIRGLRLESLDLAPADRAALKLGGAFAITAQMESAEQPTMEANDMDREQVIAELTVNDIPAALREQIVNEAQAGKDADSRIAELEGQLSDKDTLLGTLQGQLEAKLVAEFDATLDAKVAELVNWDVKGEDAQGKVDAFRRTVRTSILSELGEERTAEKLAEVAGGVWEKMKPFAEMIRDALAGPPARVAGKVRDSHKIEDTPEARAKARAAMGL